MYYRKSEIKKRCETFYKDNVRYLKLYRACQYRWQDTCDPEIEDVEYFFDLQDAIAHANTIELNIGFYGEVVEIVFKYNDLNESFDFREDIKITKLLKELQGDYDVVYCSPTNNGNNLEGSIIIEWSWEKYIGYCRNFHNIRYANFNEYESDLQDNSGSTFKQTQSLLLSKEEIQDLSKEELFDLINVELGKITKWNSFKNNPFTSSSQEKIKDLIGLEDNVNI